MAVNTQTLDAQVAEVAILPDDVRAKQSRDRKAAREAAAKAAGVKAAAPAVKRVGVERTTTTRTRKPKHVASVVEPAPKGAKPKVAKKPAAVKAAGPRAACLCGCGGFPKGRRSRFVPGHDARWYAAQKRAGKAVAH